MKVVCFIIAGAAQNHQPSLLSTLHIPNIHTIANRGCTTLLKVRDEKTQDSKTVLEFSQFVGYFSDKTLQKLYDKMFILCDDISVFEFSHQYTKNCKMVKFEEEAIFQEIKNCLNYSEIILIHLCSEPRESLLIVDKLIPKLVDDVYIAIVASFEKAEPTIKQQQIQESSWKPIQSCQLKDGKIVQDLREDFPMIASCYHEGITRCDENTKFTEESCIRNAGNGSILVDHFLREIAYRPLGLTPKYGA